MNKTKKPAEQQITKQWKDLKNRLDVILVSNNTMKSMSLREKCIAMDSMTIDERRKHILDNWGPLYLNKVENILQQLEVLENELKSKK